MRRILLAWAVAALAAGTMAAQAGPVTVFAAASLTDVFTRAGRLYGERTGRPVNFSFAASSALARQIEASGGADIFVSADRDWMDYLDRKGLIAPGTRQDLLGNRLVLIAPKSSPVSLAIVPHFDLARALGPGRLAIADPVSVPAGRYARDALSTLAVWRSVAGRIVPAENVRIALAYVARGEAALGLVYMTDALAEPRVRIVADVPDWTHSPIVYPAALTSDASAGAQAFLDFLSSKDAAAIFRKAGFVMLGAKARHDHFGRK